MISIYIAPKKIKGFLKKIFLLFSIIYLNFNNAYATTKIKVEYRVIKYDYDRFDVHFKIDKKIDSDFIIFLASIVAQKNNQDYFYIKKGYNLKGKIKYFSMNCLSKSEVVFLKERDSIYNAKLFYESVVRDFENYDILEQDSIAFLAPKNSKFSIKLKSPSYFTPMA